MTALLTPGKTAATDSRVASPPGTRARLDAVVRVGSAAALGGALALVTGWWVADGGLGASAGATGLLEALGRLSGLAASVLLLAQVLLMARIPLLERAYGQDRLARIHRVVGFTSFALLVVHIVAITWGYAAGDLLSTPRTLWNLTTTYPGMLLAVAGTAALVMVVATSVRAARRRLRYESWHLLHLYGYLGAGLALPHQLWTGQQLTSSPGRTVFWWGLWIVTAAAVVVWRIGLPVWRNLRHDLRVTSVVHEGDGIASVYLSGRSLHRLPVEAGQFLSWRFLGRRGWTRANPYSLSAAPDGTSLRISVQDVGDGSSTAARLRPGTRVLFEGPFGRLSARTRTRRKVALIGAGVGVTPLRALAEGLDYRPGEAVLLHRYAVDPLFVDEVTTLARERGLHVFHLPGGRRAADSWIGDGIPGFPDVHEVSDAVALRHWVPDLAERDVYVCGPEAWNRLVLRDLDALGVPRSRVHLESFAW